MVSMVFSFIFDAYHIFLISIGCAKSYVKIKAI